MNRKDLKQELKSNLETMKECRGTIADLTGTVEILEADKLKYSMAYSDMKNLYNEIKGDLSSATSKAYHLEIKYRNLVYRLSMISLIAFTIFLVLVAINLDKIEAGTNSKETVQAFKTDGCSMFPDGNYRSCCVTHDVEYFKGGTAAQKERADNQLELCVKRLGNANIAPIMRLGVKVGGTPLLPTPWRWGFGRKYLSSIWYDKEAK